MRHFQQKLKTKMEVVSISEAYTQVAYMFQRCLLSLKTSYLKRKDRENVISTIDNHKVGRC